MLQGKVMKKTRTALFALLILIAAAAFICAAGGAYYAFALGSGESPGETAAVLNQAGAGAWGWYALIATGGAACVMLALKFTVFNRHRLQINSAANAADDMDPLLMGKLIDNKAHDSDVAALIFYWANNGYIKLDMGGKKPAVTKLRNLPAMAPDYEQKLFYGIFRRRNYFIFEGESLFNVAVSVKRAADEKTRGSFSSASIGVSVLFALIFGLTPGIYPAIFAAFGEAGTYSTLTGFIFLLPALIVYGLAETLLYNRFKFGVRGKAVYIALIIAICGGGTAVYALVIPDHIIALAPRILIAFTAFGGAACSAFIIERNENYNRQLSEILSLRQFILKATEPDMRDLLKTEPCLFAKIYPYAYVLNLADMWASKFANTKMKAPQWSERAGQTLQGAEGLLAAMNNSAAKIAASFVARPAHERPENN